MFTLTVRESTLDVRIYRRQILTTIVDIRAVRINPEQNGPVISVKKVTKRMNLASCHCI